MTRPEDRSELRDLYDKSQRLYFEMLNLREDNRTDSKKVRAAELAWQTCYADVIDLATQQSLTLRELIHEDSD